MSLQQAMDAAREAASNVPATQEPNNSTAVAPMSLGNTLDDFLSGGSMQVDCWIQIKDGGFRLDREEKAFLEEFKAEIDLSSVQFFHGIRAEFAGNRIEYAKSFDGGRTTSKGENFAAVVAHYKANSVKPSSPYRGADMVLILTEDVKQGKTTIPAGTRVGYTTPITGFAPFQAIVKKLVSDGKAMDAGGGRLAPVGDNPKVNCTHEQRSNDASQDYGVLLMELAE